MPVPRIIISVLAAVAIAWLGIMLRDVRLFNEGNAALGQPPNPARAERLLRSSRLLNPGTAPDLSRSLAYSSLGELGKAQRILASVVRREPENLGAWRAVYALAGGRRQPAQQALAARMIRRLDPLDDAVPR